MIWRHAEGAEYRKGLNVEVFRTCFGAAFVLFWITSKQCYGARMAVRPFNRHGRRLLFRVWSGPTVDPYDEIYRLRAIQLALRQRAD